MILKCNFPFSITGKLLVNDALEALKTGVPMEDLPPVAPHHLAVYLSAAQAERVRPFAADAGLQLGQAVERLAYGIYQARRRGSQLDAGPAVTESERHRAYLIGEAIGGLAAGQIVIGEASTGLGKSRVLAHAAQHLLRGKKNIVWVAAPTVVRAAASSG